MLPKIPPKTPRTISRPRQATHTDAELAGRRFHVDELEGVAVLDPAVPNVDSRRTHLYADPAADACRLVNQMRLPSFAADGIHRTVA